MKYELQLQERVAQMLGVDEDGNMNDVQVLRAFCGPVFDSQDLIFQERPAFEIVSVGVACDNAYLSIRNAAVTVADPRWTTFYPSTVAA